MGCQESTLNPPTPSSSPSKAKSQSKLISSARHGNYGINSSSFSLVSNIYTADETNFRTFSPLLLQRSHLGPINDGALLTSSSVLTAGDDATLSLANLIDSSSSPLTFKGHTGPITCIDANRESGLFYSASRDTTVRCWQPSSAKPTSTLEGHTLTVMAVAANNEGNILASGGRDNVVKTWDLTTNQCTSSTKISRNLVTCIEWFKDGTNKYVQGSEDLTLRVWDIRGSSQSAVSLTFGKYVYFPLDVDTSDCGKYVISSSKGFDRSGCEVRVWDARNPSAPVHSMTGHEQDAVGVAYLSEDVYGWTGGKLICSASKDESLRLWDSVTGECVGVFVSEGSGMYTSVLAYEARAEAETEADTERGVDAHLLATSFYGGVYVLRVERASEGSHYPLCLVAKYLAEPSAPEDEEE